MAYWMVKGGLATAARSIGRGECADEARPRFENVSAVFVDDDLAGAGHTFGFADFINDQFALDGLETLQLEFGAEGRFRRFDFN